MSLYPWVPGTQESLLAQGLRVEVVEVSQSLTPPFMSSVISGKFLNLSMPQSSRL